MCWGGRDGFFLGEGVGLHVQSSVQANHFRFNAQLPCTLCRSQISEVNVYTECPPTNWTLIQQTLGRAARRETWQTTVNFGRTLRPWKNPNPSSKCDLKTQAVKIVHWSGRPEKPPHMTYGSNTKHHACQSVVWWKTLQNTVWKKKHSKSVFPYVVGNKHKKTKKSKAHIVFQ